ncbi:MAG: response regulator, partial [Gammaproteobacteria bacterium]|nr:response regulator [Gammaproteobacteria bacterium]
MQINLILKHLNLLLVDDNQRIHAEIYTLFSSIFKSITLAHNAETAIKYFDEKNIDIIITDIEMPDIDGLTFIENIRAQDTSIPIIILSAHADNEYLLRAANLQIDGYIIKPLNFKKLEAALQRALSRLEHRIKSVNISDKI